MKAVIVIDMPTRCDNCYLVEEWFNEYGEKVYYCPLYRMNVPKNGDICEKLKPIPERHGDLIDRQALIANGINKGFCDWYDEIKMADTIIEADKGETE